MSKKATITFNDEFVLTGAKEQAAREGKSFSRYVEDLVREELEWKLQFKIEAFYSDGSTKTEFHFYTVEDLDQSVQAYSRIFDAKKPLLTGKTLIGFRVYKYGELVSEIGKTDD